MNNLDKNIGRSPFNNQEFQNQKLQNIEQEVDLADSNLHPEIENELGLINDEDGISPQHKDVLRKYLALLRNDDNKYESNTDRTCELRQLIKKCFDQSVDIDNPSIMELHEAQRRLNKITRGVKDEGGEITKSTRNDYIKSWRKYHNITKGHWDVIQHPTIRKTIPRGNRQPDIFKKLPTEDTFTIIQSEKIVELINSAETVRDALYISLLIELGARPCEIHEISVESIHREGWDDGPCAIVEVPVKKVNKPERKMLVTRSYDLLESWLQIRRRIPTTTDKLFVNQSSRGKGERGSPCTQSNLGKKVSKAGEKIDLDISPYDLRHTSVQYWMGFSEMTEERIKEKFGWKTSQMIDLYRQITYDDLLEARKDIDGISEHEEDYFAMWCCSSCVQKNCPTQEKCKSCKRSRWL